MQINFSVIACSCMPRETVTRAYLYSDLVVHARIIGADTINEPDILHPDKERDLLDKINNVRRYEYLRLKMVVEKDFKLIPNLPDTIYVLTSTEGTACGYPFSPAQWIGKIPDSNSDYIIYGSNWMVTSIDKVKKGKRTIDKITKRPLNNTFFTSICHRTQPTSEIELKNLQKLTDLY